MAEGSDQDKSEPATPRRLEKAREEGQIPRSRELNTFLLLSTGMACLWVGGARLYQHLAAIMRAGTWFEPQVAGDTTLMLAVARSSVADAFIALMPIFVALALVSLIAPLLLGGLVLSGKALQPKFERLSPLKGIMRIFSTSTLMELAKTCAKVILIGATATLVAVHYFGHMLSLMHAWPLHALTKGLTLLALISALVVVALVPIVLLDVPWQIFSHHKKLRMTRNDLRQEQKETDGNPQVKGKLRQLRHAMARRRMMSEIPSADVIITNPTHYAVALVYAEGAGGAPRVVAKGSGLVAERIRQIGAMHGVPILSAAPLARALYHHVELGKEIPASLYAAVAEVLVWVFQLRAWRRGEGVEPERPAGLPVPPELDLSAFSRQRADSTMTNSQQQSG